ncbi:MAG: hypothetical protein H0W43_11350 [Chthoniobacterales bacterium]|nr:hypothetical protein [Chthoniobacterales bacterium]
MCNRLDVITTGYVLAKERGQDEIEVVWPVNVEMPASFHHLFSRLPGGRVTEGNIDPGLLRNYYAATASLPEDYRTSEFYCEMLGRLVTNLHPEVQREVEAFAEENFGDRPAELGPIGVHVRRLDPFSVVQALYPHAPATDLQFRRSERGMPLCEFAQPLRYYEAAMKSCPPESRFFISTDSEEAFRWLQARFGGRVFRRQTLLDNRTSIAGVREGLVDLLLLSRCNALIGTARSSFSRTAALAGKRPLLMMTTFPSIPAEWPSFNSWRWYWAYRHFFVESTFWRRWLFYVVRPRVRRIPNIPRRCRRSLRSFTSRRSVTAVPGAGTNAP